MTAAEQDQDPPILPPTAPWWAHLAIRHGVTALIALGALYILAEQIRAFPVKMEQLADKVAAAIQASAEAQIKASEATERRAEERTRNAVMQIISEVKK